MLHLHFAYLERTYEGYFFTDEHKLMLEANWDKLGPQAEGKPVYFKVTVDGKDHGADIDADGNGEITTIRLYQLVRQAGDVEARNFEIRFFDAGVEAYAFTFG